MILDVYENKYVIYDEDNDKIIKMDKITYSRLTKITKEPCEISGDFIVSYLSTFKVSIDEHNEFVFEKESN